MDVITALVMAAGSKHRVYATGSATYDTPVRSVQVSAVTFPDAEQAETFAAACMGDGVPALYCGLVDGEPTVAVMH